MLPGTLVHNLSGIFYLCYVARNSGAQLFKNILPMYVARGPGAQLFKKNFTSNVGRFTGAQLFTISFTIGCWQDGHNFSRIFLLVYVGRTLAQNFTRIALQTPKSQPFK
jgi:hypothetical protein